LLSTPYEDHEIILPLLMYSPPNEGLKFHPGL